MDLYDKKEVIKHAEMMRYGGMTRKELAYLWDKCEGRDVCEIGTMVGMSAFVMAHNARHVTCIDSWGDYDTNLHSQAVGALIDKQIRETAKATPFELFKFNVVQHPTIAPKVTYYIGKSVEVAKKIPDGMFDFLLIDGDHSSLGVYNDLIAYRYKVRPQSLIVLHDYNNPEWGVAVGLHGYLGQHAQFDLTVVDVYERFITLKVRAKP